MTTISLDQFIQETEGKTIDVDGWYGGQCWDLWSYYAQRCFGIPQTPDTNTVGGLAGSVWTDRWPQSQSLQAAFERIPASQAGQRGDVAFWAVSKAYPGSHVAIVLEDHGTTLLCLSQNPGPARRLELTKSGLEGYFRPRTRADGTDNNQNQEEEEEMHCIIQLNDDAGLHYYDGTKLHPLDNPDEVTALQTVYKQCHGHDMPCFKLGSKDAPWGTRFAAAVNR